MNKRSSTMDKVRRVTGLSKFCFASLSVRSRLLGIVRGVQLSVLRAMPDKGTKVMLSEVQMLSHGRPAQ